MATETKKNNNALYIKGCIGCLFLAFVFGLFVTAVAGYLFYLEETGLDDHSNEILVVPVVKGKPTRLEIKSDSRARAHINLWVRGPGLVEATGKTLCGTRSTRHFGKREHYRSKTDGPHKHIWLRRLSSSSRMKAKNCVATFKTLKGTGPFEIVVTKSQRPSDWF